MNTNTRAAPAGLRIARWYLVAVAGLLLGVAAITVAGLVSQAASGTTLVFSQTAMEEPDVVGPAPAVGDDPTAPAVEHPGGSTQYVDLASLGLTIAAGAVAAAGAIALFRRTRLAMPLGLAASAIAVGVGLLPAIFGMWAANYYALVDIASIAPLLIISAVMVLAAVLSGLAVWRSRGTFAPA